MMREKRDRQVATIVFFVVLFIVLVTILAQLVWTPPSAPLPRESVPDDTQTAEARVVRVLETGKVEIAPGQTQPFQRLELEIVSGPLRGERAQVEYGVQELSSADALFRQGDHVLVIIAPRAEGGYALTITDVVRTGALALLGIVFVVLAILVSGWKGVRALIGLAISFVVLLGFVMPQILAGRDPVITSIVGSFVLLAITLYLTQGWTLKTHAALLGVCVTLILTGVLAALAVNLARLSGFGSEEAMFLQTAGVAVNLRGILLAGMIVGTLGVLDDVIIGQASAVMELANANPALAWRELYRRAMNIGQDHIAATINTLVLAYVGAAMPVLLLFQIYPEPWTQTLNREMIAEEIVRTLVGSLGLIAAVPITTLIASVWRARRASAPDSMPESIS